MADNFYIRAAKKQFALSVLESVLEPIREAARECGYAIAVHGSLSKDIDLVAVPWTWEAKEASVLVSNIVLVLKQYFGEATQAGDIGHKPHGRKAFTIVFQQGAVFIDLSVMPLLNDGLDSLHPDTKRSIMAYTEIKGE